MHRQPSDRYLEFTLTKDLGWCIFFCIYIYICMYIYVKHLIQKSFCLTLIFLVLFLCVMGSSTKKTNLAQCNKQCHTFLLNHCIVFSWLYLWNFWPPTSDNKKRAATYQYFVTTGKSTWLSSSKSTYRNDLWPFSSAMRCAEGRERVQLSSLEQAGNSSSMTTWPRGWNLPWRKRRGAVYRHLVSKMTWSEYRSFSEAPPPHHHHVMSLFTHNSHLDYRYFIIKVYSPTQIHLWKRKISVKCVWYDPSSSWYNTLMRTDWEEPRGGGGGDEDHGVICLIQFSKEKNGACNSHSPSSENSMNDKHEGV